MATGSKLLALLLVTAGLVWAVGFRKQAGFHPNMVASVAIAVSLLGTGAILWTSGKRQRSVSILATLLLWSLSYSAYLLAWQRQAAQALMIMVERQVHELSEPSESQLEKPPR